MHEFSLVSSLLDRVEAEAGARGATAVHRVRLRVGELAGVESDLLIAAYELLRERSVCAAAELEIDREAARWQCPHCRREPVIGSVLRCPDCGRPVGLVAGDGIILERIEMEVA